MFAKSLQEEMIQDKIKCTVDECSCRAVSVGTQSNQPEFVCMEHMDYKNGELLPVKQSMYSENLSSTNTTENRDT